MNKKNILLIDNFDSFVYNLADEFARLNCKVTSYRANWQTAAALQYIERQQPDLIVFSPGPGHPQEARLCHEILTHAALSQKILGVCLGHQCIIEHFGGEIVRCQNTMHGKPALIAHQQRGLFANLSQPLQVARYHSLVGNDLPECLSIDAYCNDIIMAVHHKTRPIYGLQFHPESVLTPEGSLLIRNCLENT